MSLPYPPCPQPSQRRFHHPSYRHHSTLLLHTHQIRPALKVEWLLHLHQRLPSMSLLYQHLSMYLLHRRRTISLPCLQLQNTTAIQLHQHQLQPLLRPSTHLLPLHPNLPLHTTHTTLNTAITEFMRYERLAAHCNLDHDACFWSNSSVRFGTSSLFIIAIWSRLAVGFS